MSEKQCAQPDCHRRAFARGFCSQHYKGKRKDGTLSKLFKTHAAKNKGHLCSEPKCAKFALVRGLCQQHYQQFRNSQAFVKLHSPKEEK